MAAIIAIPMRKNCISIAGAIDRVPYAGALPDWAKVSAALRRLVLMSVDRAHDLD